MAFEQVDVASLRSSIQAQLDSISTVKSKSIMNTLADHKIWQTRSADQFQTKMSDLLDKQIPTLVTHLKEGLRLADLIERYKVCEDQIDSLEDRIETLSNRDDPPTDRIRFLRANVREYKKEMLEIEQKANDLVS